ncbi:hypothetical protein DBR11_24760 [Pedobacter sp. HMWF019]|uniref:SRPBCC family protein n=1 Tax=Pedobacter sp. HMWF019 TaxID=2056856 RepID=UPI000D37B27A|nr:SRPBCC family protein [Pedobacter sp. HMWF019]PTS93690.1 hypothetical protein DBR11_24760 [Pedobacter sp. HMWF019]
MKSYHIEFYQNIPVNLKQAWDFFSSPLNLQKITPSDMRFKVTSPIKENQKMYPGMIITYKISPISGLRLNWMTEITHMKEESYFIDEQRFGPYKFWHHQHHFKPIDGGIIMHDILTYSLPLGILGQIANSVFVANKLQQIFIYRKEKIKELFGEL